MRTVIRLLHDGAAHFNDAPYLGEKIDREYVRTSFKEADEISSQFAATLVMRGYQKGQTIAILSEGRSAWVLGEFGLLKAGCISVPLSTKLSEEEILFRLEHAEVRAILISENNFKKFAALIPRLSRPMEVICISPTTPSLLDMVKEAGLEAGKNCLFWGALIEEGRLALLDNLEYEGRNIRLHLAEREAGIAEDDVVTISYTSGTTGNPKGIMLTHLNYWDNTQNSAEVVHVQEGWKSLIMLPLDHSFAHTVGLYIFLYRGLCMYFVDARGGPMASLRNLPINLQETNPDFLLTVPALSGNFMKKMIQGIQSKGAFVEGIFRRGLAAGIARAGNGFNKPALGIRIRAFFPWLLAELLVFPKLRAFFGRDIKFCVGGGALLEIRQQEFFNAIGVPVFQGYGLTENTPIICTNSPMRHKFGTSGNIIPNLRVRIMKDANTECKRGEIGEIVTKGNSVMKGYFKNPEASAETLRDGWLWSGDLGYIDEDDFLVVTGREKALLIAADGEKYSPETIEEAIINSSRYVDQIMAYNEQCKFTSLLITLNTEALKADTAGKNVGEVITIIEEDLLAFQNKSEYATIPAQWRPASFAIISEPFGEEHGLVNSTMKLVRHKVRDHYKDRLDELYASGTASPDIAGNREALHKLGF